MHASMQASISQCSSRISSDQMLSSRQVVHLAGRCGERLVMGEGEVTGE